LKLIQAGIILVFHGFIQDKIIFLLKNLIMEKYNIPDDLKVFGFQVKTFPNGIGESFDKLMKMLPNGDGRSFYGISKFVQQGIAYYVATTELAEGEAVKFGCEEYIIEKGIYLKESIMDWRNNIECIKDVFDRMLKDQLADRSHPCVEWYKTMDEMFCLVKMNMAKIVA